MGPPFPPFPIRYRVLARGIASPHPVQRLAHVLHLGRGAGRARVAPGKEPRALAALVTHDACRVCVDRHLIAKVADPLAEHPSTFQVEGASMAVAVVLAKAGHLVGCSGELPGEEAGIAEVEHVVVVQHPDRRACAPGQHARSRGDTDRARGVRRRKAHARGGDAVQVRRVRPGCAAVAHRVGTPLVGHQPQDVGSFAQALFLPLQLSMSRSSSPSGAQGCRFPVEGGAWRP